MMRRMDTRKLPNVTSYRDRHGKLRWRFRKKGLPSHTFRSEPGTRQFRDEWEWANGRGDEKPGAAREPVGYRRASAGLDGVSLIYFIGSARGPVKIGKTTSLSERMKKLQTGYHERLELLAVMPGGAQLEAELHARFAKDRLTGEWFRRTIELTTLMRQNRPHVWRTDLTQNVANPGKVL
jgi:hypothetical protein